MTGQSHGGPPGGPLYEAILLDAQDNVSTALRSLEAGQTIRVAQPEGMATLTLTEAIPFGHKIAQFALPAGTDVVKYGAVIGRAKTAIAAGGLVHVHNVESLRGRGDLQEAGERHG